MLAVYKNSRSPLYTRFNNSSIVCVCVYARTCYVLFVVKDVLVRYDNNGGGDTRVPCEGELVADDRQCGGPDDDVRSRPDRADGNKWREHESADGDGGVSRRNTFVIGSSAPLRRTALPPPPCAGG